MAMKPENSLGNLLSEKTENTSDDPRIFRLHDRDGKEFQIQTKRVGAFEDLCRGISEDGEGEAPAGASAIIDAFRQHQGEFEKSGELIKKRPHILITGGFVRDILLGSKPNDIDFTSDLPADKALELLGALPGLRKIGKHGKASEVVRLNFENGEEYEVSYFKQSEAASDNSSVSPGQDALARDLTVNAVFYNPLSGNIIDYAGGMQDIMDRRLRFTGNPDERIMEDGLRMFRYVRFLKKTGFDGDVESEEAIRRHSGEVGIIDMGRIKDELEKTMKLCPPRELVEELDRLGLLETYLPDIKALQGCEQGPPYHLEGDVYKHTLMVLDCLPKDAGPRLVWAAILHDIAKPETREESIKNGRPKVSFHKHDKLGAEKLRQLLPALRFSKDETKEIAWIIEHHQLIFQKVVDSIDKSSDKQKARNRAKGAIKEMIAEIGIDTVRDLVYLAMADTRGKISDESLVEKNDDILIKELFEEAVAELRNERESGLDPKKLINGKMVMEVFGMGPGPEVGRIQKELLARIREQNLIFASAEEVRDFVERQKKATV